MNCMSAVSDNGQYTNIIYPLQFETGQVAWLTYKIIAQQATMRA